MAATADQTRRRLITGAATSATYAALAGYAWGSRKPRPRRVPVGTSSRITAAPAMTFAVTRNPNPTPPPVSDRSRFSGVLGVGQSNGVPITLAGVTYPARTVYDAIADAPGIGARLVRVEAMVPQAGAWDYAALDRKFTAARTAGVGVVLLVDYTPADCWVGTLPAYGHVMPQDPAMQDRWAGYVMRAVDYLAARYPATLVAVEYGNEPNGWEFGSARGTAPFSPAAYARLAGTLHRMIVAKWPNVLGILGGTAPSPTKPATTAGTYTEVAPREWYPMLKAAGLTPGRDFDHLAHHFYDDTIDSPWSAPFDVLWGVWSGPQVWATEQARNAATDPTGAATWTAANLDRWKGKGTRAGAWLQFCDYDRNTADGYGFYGLRDGAGTPRPALAEYRARAV